MTGARILASIPLILASQALSAIGYRVAGSPHLNPYHRADRARPKDTLPCRNIPNEGYGLEGH
jgi:hypothetical protein